MKLKLKKKDKLKKKPIKFRKVLKDSKKPTLKIKLHKGKGSMFFQ